MAKFVIVKQAPRVLERGEIVINQPDFMDQVVANIKKAPKHKQTAINHLREVLNSIAEKYDQDMNVFKIRLLNYQGLTFNTNEDMSAIVVRILKNEYPQIFDKCLDHQLKNRPMSTKLIYYVGELNTTKPFYDAGLDMIDEKDIETYMAGKPKKIVGRPAITNEEAGNNGGEV
jgi:hypothetical protein